jgi:hypothetical protein
MKPSNPPDVRALIRSALAVYPVRVVARVLGISPATVSALAVPDELCRCMPGSLALAEKNAAALAELTYRPAEARTA